jgi:cytochrome c556
MNANTLLRSGLGAAIAAALVSVIAVRAQQGAGAGGAAPAPKPMIPMTAASILLKPDTYWGENVSMMAAVGTVLSKTVFTVNQGKAATGGQDVLVIAPNLYMPVVPNAYLTVQGEVFKFDPAEVAKRAKNNYALDLPPDVAAKYQGRPAVFATGVITAQLVDIGKRLPPPLTAAETALRAAMVEINTNNTALRGGLDPPDAAKIKTQIAALKHGFTEADSFFKSHNASDAAAWSGDALKFVGTMEAATAGATPKIDDVRTAVTGLNGLCATCHTARRERQDDGSFRFKK